MKLPGDVVRDQSSTPDDMAWAFVDLIPVGEHWSWVEEFGHPAMDEDVLWAIVFEVVASSNASDEQLAALTRAVIEFNAVHGLVTGGRELEELAANESCAQQFLHADPQSLSLGVCRELARSLDPRVRAVAARSGHREVNRVLAVDTHPVVCAAMAFQGGADRPFGAAQESSQASVQLILSFERTF